MPNQLSIPFKKTYAIQIKQSVRDYILKHHADTHPDAFKWDINRWETLRKDGVGGVVHVDRIKAAISYHAQLVFILTKLPSDIGLQIPYAPAFNPSALPVTLQNLAYERVAVLFNLAALQSQLAASEDRSNPQGLKQAIALYQSAAGTLNYLVSAALPKLHASATEEEFPLEFTESCINSLEVLMLAQGQECAWQRAVMDHYRNGVIAKLAAKISTFYQASLMKIREASPSIKHLFPAGWIAHLETKQLHFEAAAQYRKSVDDLESHRYGHEIARLSHAQAFAKKGYDIARRGNVAPAVLQDIKSILETVQKSLTRAERDNDLIYHQDVPSISALPPIQEASLVQSLVNTGLIEPKTAVGDDAAIFGELLGWGAKMAIDIYKDRRQNWIKEEVTDRAQHLDDTVTETLRSLNLPASLEALEKPIGLPPSLLKKAEEVRLEQGPTRIESSISDVQRLAQRDMDILNEAMDVLDQEAEEDEAFREETPSDRLSSHEANNELVAKAQRYRGILVQAGDSDEVVRRKWDEWEQNIIELTWSESDLEASVPSSTVSSNRFSSGGPNSTQAHARALRVLLENLDDLQRARKEQVARATRLVDAEDITPRITKAAAGFEQWVEVQPAMLEDVLDEELAKYEKFRQEIVSGEEKQEALLKSIKERNALFLKSRKDDPTIKEREHALQSLDLTYHKYKEITRNLDEGLKFYNDFGGILTQFRETCKEWVNIRRNEMHSLTSSMQSISIQPVSQHSTLSSQPSPPLAPVAKTPELEAPVLTTPTRKELKVAMDLPPPDSDEWETMDLPPAPLMSAKKPAPPRRAR